jgi:protein SCO1
MAPRTRRHSGHERISGGILIRTLAKRHRIYYKTSSRADIDHTFLTSLVDPGGMLRVQYVGVRFDPDEMLRDLHSLLRETKGR